MKTSILSILLILTMLVTACNPIASTTEEAGTDSAGLTPVKLGLGFIPNVQFGVFYVGLEKGFYEEEGLDVSLDYGFENDYLKLVGTNEWQFMIGSGDQVVLGRAQGLPVQYVMNWFTQYPVVVFAKADAGINNPEDLAGKKIGIPGPFGASYVALRGILDAAGLDESDITLESIGFTQAAAVSEDTVEAAMGYGVNEPIMLELEGIEVSQIKLDSYMKLPANGLVTNEQAIENDPELVGKMVRATMKSIQYTLDNPDESFDIILKFVPEAADNLEANRAVYDAVLGYWTPQDGAALGETKLEDWESAAALMERIGLADTVVPAEELFTNEFIK